MIKRITLSFAIASAIVFSAAAQMRVHQINVGQGSATLVEFPCAAILVDAGGEKNPLFDGTEALKDYLDNFFTSHPELDNTLEAIYITHPHHDHTWGIPVVLDHYKIKNAITNGLENGSGRWEQIRLHNFVTTAEAEIPSHSDDVGFKKVFSTDIPATGLTSAVIDPVNCPGTDPVIRILWGSVPVKPAGWNSTDFNEGNNHSLAIRIDYGNASLLITGDLEQRALEDMVNKYGGGSLLDADIYLVSHHGSTDGVTAEFLEKVTPEMALIGCGDPARETSTTAWAYGHPRKAILEMLKTNVTGTRPAMQIQAGTAAKKFENYSVSKAIYATGWDGDIILEGTAAGNWRETGSAMPVLVNLNTATQGELEALPGLGPTKAKAIIDYRSAHGNFTTVDELDNVQGIGPATVELVRQWVGV